MIFSLGQSVEPKHCVILPALKLHFRNFRTCLLAQRMQKYDSMHEFNNDKNSKKKAEEK